MRLSSMAVAALLTLAAACDSVAPWGGAPDRLYQVSVVDALLAGDYDGSVTMAQLRSHGDFGLGTFDRLDGELVLLDGTVYKITGDGSVVVPNMLETTPWAAVTKFAVDTQFRIDGPVTIDELESKIDESVGNPNIFHAVRLDARLSDVKLRSVHAQSKPYPDLVTAAASQSVWTHRGVDGTLVGIRSPSYAGTMVVPGYHWHFISDDRTIGGHVLAADVQGGIVRIDQIRNWDVELPDGTDFQTIDLRANRAKELDAVERSRG